MPRHLVESRMPSLCLSPQYTASWSPRQHYPAGVSIPLQGVLYALKLTSLLDGSVTVNLTSGATLSTLHFHDDESRSMQMSRSSPNAATWGGEGKYLCPEEHVATNALLTWHWNASDLLQHIRAYCQLLKSTLQPRKHTVNSV